MIERSKRHFVYQILFLLSAICLNLPPVVLGILGVFEWCRYFASWLAANAALTLANAIAAVYIIIKLQKAEASENETTRNNLQNSSSQPPTDPSAEPTIEQGSSQVDNAQQHSDDSDQAPRIQPNCCLCFAHTSHSKHLRHLIRYDCLVSTYCIFVIFWVFWLADGVERFVHLDETAADDLENCAEIHESYVLYSFCMGYGYLAIVIASMLMVHLPERQKQRIGEKSAVEA